MLAPHSRAASRLAIARAATSGFAVEMRAVPTATRFAPARSTSGRLAAVMPPIAKNGIPRFTARRTDSRPEGFSPGFCGEPKTGPAET
jgi:hypothetical protein